MCIRDSTDSELVARYKETRRSHPLAADGRVLDGITSVSYTHLDVYKRQVQTGSLLQAKCSRERENFAW